MRSNGVNDCDVVSCNARAPRQRLASQLDREKGRPPEGTCHET